MSGAEIGLAISVFLACAVEGVEALTIVLAVGVTRSWRSALTGVGAAALVLAVLVAALGPALATIPIDALRVVVGALLLVFGLQWLRKSVLRYAGLKAIRDERRSSRPRPTPPARRRAPAGVRWLRVHDRVQGCAARGARGRVHRDHVRGQPAPDRTRGRGRRRRRGARRARRESRVRRPLARVPENTLKFCVGVMLTSFGIFWGTEGAGASWPGGDGALLVLVPGMALAALAMVRWLRRTAEHRALGEPA